MREPGAVTDERDIAALAVVVGSFDRNSVDLVIREQPQKGRACRNTTKAKWPLEPPPVVELTVHPTAGKDLLPIIINSPNYFCKADLKSLKNRHTSSDTLTGTTVSSLHKVKSNNTDAGVFVFSDLHVKSEGEYSLVFSLLEMRTHNGDPYAVIITSTESQPFVVQHHSKPLGPVKESSHFLKSLASQGVKMRLRKDATKRKRERDDWTSNLHTAAAYMGWSDRSGFVAQTVQPPRGPAEDVSNRIHERPKAGTLSFDNSSEFVQTPSVVMLPPPPMSMHQSLSSSLVYNMAARDRPFQDNMPPPDQFPTKTTEVTNWGYSPAENLEGRQLSQHHIRHDSGYVSDQVQPSQTAFALHDQQGSAEVASNKAAQYTWDQNPSAFSNSNLRTTLPSLSTSNFGDDKFNFASLNQSSHQAHLSRHTDDISSYSPSTEYATSQTPEDMHVMHPPLSCQHEGRRFDFTSGPQIEPMYQHHQTTMQQAIGSFSNSQGQYQTSPY